MDKKMERDNALLDWQKKTKDEMDDIYCRYIDAGSALFLSHMLTLTANPDYNTATTWLIKHFMEEGGKLTAKHEDFLWKQRSQLQGWAAKLHFLQLLPYLNLSLQKPEIVHAFLHAALQEKSPFVRAWAYNGFWLLASTFSVYKEEVHSLFSTAMENEKASVKARIRRILASIDKD